MTLYVIARNAQSAARHAAAAPRVWFTDESAAVEEYNGIRDEELRREFQIYAVEDGPGEHGKVATLIDKIGETAAMVTLVLLAIAAWIALPGEAFAASITQPASAADHWSLWIAGLIFIAAAVMGIGAFLANLFRNDAREFYGENYDGND